MTLFERMMTDCVRLVPANTEDGEGGRSTIWNQGAAFRADIVFNNSTEARRADKDGVKSLYTVTVPADVSFNYHDVFKRVSDGKIFRATSDGDDIMAPSMASFHFRQFSAEEWRLIE